jgi:hypothetical protein
MQNLGHFWFRAPAIGVSCGDLHKVNTLLRGPPTDRLRIFMHRPA